MNRLLILGASGHGKVVADCATKNGYENIVFLDDDESLTRCGKYSVAGKCVKAGSMEGDMIVAVGNAWVRQRLQESLGQGRLVKLIHPSAVLAEGVEIGAGSVVMAGVVINSGTSIGVGCIINTLSSVDHDCIVGDFVHISVGAHAAGNVRIGTRTWIGAGAVVSNNVEICGDCVIGAGAVVVKDITESGIYMGVPAKKKDSGGKEKDKNKKAEKGMRRVLVLAHVASMISYFNMPNIELLQKMGYKVDVACNFQEGSVCTEKEINGFKDRLEQMHVRFYHIDFAREVVHVGRNCRAICQVAKLMDKNHYAFIHCHTPMGGVAGRIGGWLTHTKVIYTAHGFHFYKGAPKVNWLVYYPIEKLCSYLTDVLITINREDYRLARRKMKAGRIEYVPGVGVQTQMAQRASEVSPQDLRNTVGCGSEEKLFLSVGELNANKNHVLVVKALGELKQEKRLGNFHYVIAGKGEKDSEIIQAAKQYGIADRVHLLGFRTDIWDWYRAADVFVFPSRREGLPVALMEAMTFGLPVVCSNIRGNQDLIDGSGGGLFASDNREQCKRAILTVIQKDAGTLGERNKKYIENFSTDIVMKKFTQIYSRIDRGPISVDKREMLDR